MTNFEKVAYFNSLIGNAKGNLESPDWEQLEAQFDIIRQEFEEMEASIKARDIKMLRDDIADVLVTTYGMAHRSGYDADLDMDLVNESNMSKFCRTQEEALQTGAKYETIDVQVEYRNIDGLIAVVSRIDQIGKDNKHYPKGKLLKSINYFDPRF